MVGAIILDDEFAGFANCNLGNFSICVNGISLSYFLFPLGLVIAVFGVFFLSKRKSNQHEQKRPKRKFASTPMKSESAVTTTGTLVDPAQVVGGATPAPAVNEADAEETDEELEEDKKQNVWARWKDVECQVTPAQLRGCVS